MNLLNSLVFSRPARAITRRFKRGRLTVFMLHRVTGVHKDIPGHEIARIALVLDEMRRHGLRFVSVTDIIEAVEKRAEIIGDAVAFTADDGYEDQAEILAPLFLQRGIPLTLFVVSGLLDGLDWPWDAKVDWLVRQTTVKTIHLRLGGTIISYPLSTTSARIAARTELVEIFAGLTGDRLPAALSALESAAEMALPTTPPMEYRPTNWARLRELESAGLSVAPHTVTHRIVSRLSSRDVSWEIEESLRRVRAELAAPLAALAWPVGRERHLGTRELDLAAAADVRVSFAAEGGYSDFRAARNDRRLRHKLGRFSWADSAPLMLRYATGLEAARESLTIGSRSPRIPHWVMKFSNEGPSTWRQRIGRTAREVIQEYRDATTMRLALQPAAKRVRLEKVERLVFVCKGNICRSPFAEAVARSRGWRSASYGLDVTKNQPADLIANKISLMLGLDVTDHVARSILDGDFSATDCLVAMDPEQYSALRAIRESTGCQLALLGTWGSSPVLRVPDPYGKGQREMERVFRLIEDCVDGLLGSLRPPNRAPD